MHLIFSASVIFCQIKCITVAYKTFVSNNLQLPSCLSRFRLTATPDIPKESNFTIFAGVKFWHPVSSALGNLNISKPTPIQSASLVALTTGFSCLLHAETGSGKTLCYLLPLLKRLYYNEYRVQQSDRVKAIIILPTKELAVQVIMPQSISY